MTIAIAGRVVQEGDPLYHRGLQAWGTVVGFDVGIAVLRVIQGETSRTFRVQANGYINNVRQVFWHEPLWLDLPRQDVSAYQRILDAVLLELK